MRGGGGGSFVVLKVKINVLATIQINPFSTNDNCYGFIRARAEKHSLQSAFTREAIDNCSCFILLLGQVLKW